MSEIEIRTGNQGVQVETDTSLTDVSATTQDVPQAQEGNTPTESTLQVDPATSEAPQSDLDVQGEIDKQVQTEEEVKAELVAKGIDFDALDNELEAKGQLSEATYQKLEEAGYPKKLVDSYIDNMNLRSEMFVNAVVGQAGGEDQFTQLQGFIKAQGQDAVNAFNGAIESGNLAMIKTLMNGSKAQMAKAYGTANPTIMGSSSGTGQGDIGFTSKEQMIEAMSERRYGRDKAYTKEVEEKVLKSQGIY